MRLFRMWIIPVLLVTGSLASAQQPSSMKLQGRPKITGEWASSPTTPGPIIVPTGGVEGMPAAPMPGAPMPGAAIGVPVAGPVASTPMGSCGAGGCSAGGCSTGGCGMGSCGGTCDSCARAGCLSRLKEWFCSRPLHACDKQVCHDPVPPLYQFFPCPREGYCPRLAPPTCCPPPVHLIHPICSTRQAWANTSCGGCGATCGAASCNATSCGTPSCGAASCGTASCGTPSSGSCASCESGRGSWLRFFRPLRSSSCKDFCCTPSAQCFTHGQTTGGCADGNCGPK